MTGRHRNKLYSLTFLCIGSALAKNSAAEITGMRANLFSLMMDFNQPNALFKSILSFLEVSLINHNDIGNNQRTIYL